MKSINDWDVSFLVLASHVYTSQRQFASKRVAVVEPVVEVPDSTDPISYSKMEIICPDVVLPGTFFNCTADIPKGQGLSATITLRDDLGLKVDEVSTIHVPGNEFMMQISIILVFQHDIKNHLSNVTHMMLLYRSLGRNSWRSLMVQCLHWIQQIVSFWGWTFGH